jgi:hypothetical protein
MVETRYGFIVRRRKFPKQSQRQTVKKGEEEVINSITSRQSKK